MPWNEPGKNNSGGQGPRNNRPNNNQKPPDFEQIIKDALNSIKNMFGFGGNNKNKGTGSTGGGQGGSLVVVLLIVVALLVWASAYRIDESERGVVLVFGEYSHTVQPGLRFTWPQPIAKVYRENVRKIRQEDNSGQMLTEDKNLIEIDYSVQYRVDEARVNDYLFNLANPENTVSQAAESAMRQVAGTSTLDHIINESRTDVNFEVQSELQKMLDNYQAGIEVRQVNITEVHPPINVKEAFDDVVKAREDQKTFINKANEYAKGEIPKAEGQVLKIIQDAEGYRESLIAEAQGEAQRFDRLRMAYEESPEITRKRMYLETMEQVLGGMPKVMITGDNSNQLMYLPLDKLINQSGNSEVLDLGTTVVRPDTGSQSSGQSSNNTGGTSSQRSTNRTARGR
ncbi:FtsH protease activity modulator HflK [Marinicella gelatinilytica]|uniref:FtsH protease activity modulator HflK n=1 Tax=Marinicella gelatinilytica TaxID=2996017 RepID=UPI002260C8DC|nr:FtsH protease activity modulator HflK [Marinicella gelatinilytica]MCX7545715.1 FtsH protease activity modulator HflK [Marinicella gelatinilytica]